MTPARIAFLAVLAAMGLLSPVCGDEDARQPVSPTPLQDDAALHDVTFVGSKYGWAAGDHGVVWHTRDGGVSWELLPTPVDVPLRSVCFLTDRVGWVAGGQTAPWTRTSNGVLLATRDGGETWQRVGDGVLPRLHYVKFFGPERGIVVGSATAQVPSGVYTTQDGGASWQPVAGSRSESWRTADFLQPDLGVFAGAGGRAVLWGEGRLLEPRLGDLAGRTLRGVRLDQQLGGWLVGDGGLVRTTHNGGVVWESPEKPLPRDVRQLFDFHGVDSRGKRVWVVGAPGSIVWHSPNGGTSWQRQRTRQTVPLHDVCFPSETHGTAVGACGTILRTTDGGHTWLPARGGGRRVALLAVHGYPHRVSFGLLAKQSLERGHRSAVLLPARREDGDDDHDRAVDLSEAVSATGGNAVVVDWQFPVALPDLEKNEARLVEEWNRLTEGKLARVFLGKLVARIRTWRPNVIVLDQPPGDDAVTKVINEAVLRAVREAADPTRHLAQQELAGLSEWNVRKVYLRLAPGSGGDTTIDPYEYLPRTGTTVLQKATTARSRIVPGSRSRSTRQTEGYRLLLDTAAASPAHAARGGFFAGIVLGPGSDARRKLKEISNLDLERERKLVERQRNLQAYAEQYLSEPRHAAGLLAQLRESTRGMPEEQAALLLRDLADEHRRRSDWDAAEGTLVELITRFPDEPVTLDAARWLLRLWGSTEAALWQSQRTEGGNRLPVAGGSSQVANVEQALRTALHEADLPRADRAANPPEDELQRVAGLRSRPDEWRAPGVQEWPRRALFVARLLREKAPQVYRAPDVQFVLASIFRGGGHVRPFEEILRKFEAQGTGDAWQRTARAEAWMLRPTTAESPKPVARCVRAAERPNLDGQLSDPCWAAAKPIDLRPAGEEHAFDEDAPRPLLMFAWDAEYLYVAASVPRDPKLPADPPQQPGRAHDADLDGFDKLSFFLDVDRDYATWYTLEVDQRGWTKDACWNDASWNPKWYVASAGDEDRWRTEVAIPLAQLVPARPTRGTTWALGLVRTKPAVGLESWTEPVTSSPQPETFGLLRFD